MKLIAVVGTPTGYLILDHLDRSLVLSTDHRRAMDAIDHALSREWAVADLIEGDDE